MSRGALLTGTIGGIVGTITSAVGITWALIYIIFLNEINNYLGQLGTILITLTPWMPIPDYTGPWPIPIFPSWSLFGVFSYILAIFLIVTGILIGIGFYGMYKIGGGAMGVVGLIFSIIGSTLGALLIIIGNTTIGYMYAKVMVEMAIVDFWPVTTPNFQIIWLGFVVLGFTFIMLGSASYSVRDMTMKPSASQAAGILSIIGAIFFIGGLLIQGIMLIIGCGLMFVAFILWAVIFYSSRNM